LSFNCAKRIEDVGLSEFPPEALPSEDLLAKWEAAGKIAAEKGRIYVGSADADDLMALHRPAWARSPAIDLMPSGGSWDDRLKAALDMKKARSLEERVHYQGFATFLGHVFSWGLKLVMMKVCSQTHLLSYVFILTRVAEEHGGVATAYHYDVKVRKEMATELEREKPNVLRWLLELNDDTARAAKDKAQSGAGRVAKFASAAAAGSSAQSAAGNHGRGSGGKAVGKGGKSGKGDNRPVRSPPRKPPSQRGRSRSRNTRKDGWYQQGWYDGKKK
jgi:hypothetical protein